jgi:hypothetical protein
MFIHLKKRIFVFLLFLTGVFFLYPQASIVYIGSQIFEKDIETGRGTFMLYSSSLFEGGSYEMTKEQIFSSIEVIIKPKGWSADGLFSGQYLIHRGTGGETTILKIVDTVSDEILRESYREIEFFSVQYEEEIVVTEKNNAGERLRDHENLGEISLFKKDLTDVVLPQAFPRVYGSQKYTCWFNYTVEKLNEGNARSIIKWKLYAGNGFGSKVISSGEYKTYEGVISGKRIVGYYKSPYENRIVIVVQTVDHNGEIYHNSFEFYGCHLNAGFDGGGSR